jgi:Fe2+ transport system protein FeoA
MAGEIGPTLADVPPGKRARIADWRAFSVERRQQLRGYGLSIGSLVRVIQQTAATVVLVDYTELALERDLARLILVEAPDGDAEGRPAG